MGLKSLALDGSWRRVLMGGVAADTLRNAWSAARLLAGATVLAALGDEEGVPIMEELNR